MLPFAFRFTFRDVIYLALIGAMAFWIWSDRRRQMAYQEMLHADLRTLAMLPLERHLMAASAEIQKNAAELEDSSAQRTMHLLRRYEKLPDPLKQQIETLTEQCWAGDVQNVNRFSTAITPESWQSLHAQARALSDSLTGSLDETTRTMVQMALGLDSASTYWQTVRQANSFESGVVLKDLRMRVMAAQWTALTHLSESTAPPTRCFPNWEPVLMPRSPFVKVGEPFEADVFLTEIPNKRAFSKNIIVLVNGDTISMESGVARFQKNYTTPGKKNIQVEIQLHNPLTRDITHLKKEYGIVVL